MRKTIRNFIVLAALLHGAASAQSPRVDGRTHQLPAGLAATPVSKIDQQIRAIPIELPASAPPANRPVQPFNEIGYVLTSQPEVRDALDAIPWNTASDGSQVLRIEVHSAHALG